MKSPDSFDSVAFLQHLAGLMTREVMKHLASRCDSHLSVAVISDRLLTPIQNGSWPENDDLEMFGDCKTLLLVFGGTKQAVTFPLEAQFAATLYLSFYRNAGGIKDDSLAHLAVASLIDCARVCGCTNRQWILLYLDHLASTAPVVFIAVRFYAYLGLLLISSIDGQSALSMQDWKRFESMAVFWNQEGTAFIRENVEGGNEHFLRTGWWRNCVHEAVNGDANQLQRNELPAIKRFLESAALA